MYQEFLGSNVHRKVENFHLHILFRGWIYFAVARAQCWVCWYDINYILVYPSPSGALLTPCLALCLGLLYHSHNNHFLTLILSTGSGLCRWPALLSYSWICTGCPFEQKEPARLRDNKFFYSSTYHQKHPTTRISHHRPAHHYNG